jgi:hypothetical protein
MTEEEINKLYKERIKETVSEFGDLLNGLESEVASLETKVRVRKDKEKIDSINPIT